MENPVWKITTSTGEVWFEDWSATKADAEESARSTFGDGCIIEEI